MSEGTGRTPEEVRRSLIRRSAEDGALRRRLLEDPRGTVEEELGASLPEGIEVRVVEETPETIYLVLPPRATTPDDGEISERDLEAVAGGWDDVPVQVQSFHVCPPTRSRKQCDPLP